jgi:hypothetical protein
MSGRPRALRRSAIVCTLGLMLAVPACAQNPCPPEVPMPVQGRLEASLVRLIGEAPDSVVGVLVLTTAQPGVDEQRALREAGLRIGVVAGDVVTGRVRACDAARLAELSFVRSVQLAREVSRPPPPAPL